jgi:hypothetical protein
MILGMTIHWQCDRCGYCKTEDYGEEPTVHPVIRCPPPGWEFFDTLIWDGTSQRLVRRVECDQHRGDR